MQTRRGALRKPAIAALLFALLLLLAEAGARLIEVVRPDAAVVKLERLLSPPPKEPGSLRVSFYGESTVEGAPIPAYGFPAQFEFWLRQLLPGRRLYFENFGRSGEDSGFVRDALERTAGAQPDLIVVLTGHNEFLRGEEGLAELAERHLALARVVERMGVKLRSILSPGLPRSVVAPDPLAPWVRGSPAFRRKIEAFTANLRRTARLAREQGVPLLLLTDPANLTDWPPAFRNLAPGGARDQSYEERMAKALAWLASGTIEELEASLEELRGTYGDDALVLYLEASVRASSGEHEAARELFQRAKEEDPIPWRALHEINDAIRTVAGEEGAILVDLVGAFEREADDGLVGSDLFADNCHPNLLGCALIARDLIAALSSRRILVEQAIPAASLQEQLERFLSGSFGPERRRALDKEYHIRNGIYAMKPPFYNFAASRASFQGALAIDGSDWVIWANLATLSLRQGRREDGERELERALLLRGRPFDLFDRDRTPYLREAVQAASGGQR